MRLLTLLAPFSLLAATLSAAQPAAKADAPKAQKLVQVSTLNTIEANREFQANVQLLQAQRQAAVELNTASRRRPRRSDRRPRGRPAQGITRSALT